jgi:DDE superfamily endonuclease
VQVLLCGVLLCSGSTITAALRVMGLGGEADFANFHRVLNRAQWSAFKASEVLLGLLVKTFAPANGEPLIFALDDTIVAAVCRKPAACAGSACIW